MAKAKCAIYCSDATYIYEEINSQPKRIIVLFSPGAPLDSDNESKLAALVGACGVINDYLSQYINNRNQLVLCGHSAGFINAITIATVLSFNDSDFDNLADWAACDPRMGQQSYKRWPCSKLKVKDPSRISDISEKNWMSGDKADYFRSEFGPAVIKQDIVLNNRESLRKNVIVIGSGGHPLMTSDVPLSNWKILMRFL